LSTSLPGNLAVSPTIPLTDPLRAAYNDLYDKLEAQYQGTADAVVLEAIGPMRDEVKNILTKDDMCRFSQDSALFAPLLAQINSTNDGLKTLKSQIASTASHFAMAGDILAAVSKVFGLLGIA
jgi:hypothetical protein